ncbi:potassium voltage-gated channel subfamily H member 6-like isoform X3 [Acropora muricata]|uniref:potassium voltage-gated channel subfamily H member 6-like isoform X3 n=1 Tax=Acropora muricata TaxID=159855 RepID=UPI0034E37824
MQVMSLSSTSNSRVETLYPCTLRHDSLFKAVWDWLILALVIFTAIEIPYSVAFLIPLQDKGNTPKLFKVTPLLVFNLWVDLMFIMDILINFRTTFVDSNSDEVISNPKQIALHYLKTWFVVDFVAAIPFEFMVLKEVERLDSATTLFGLLKTARLLRLVRVTRKLDRYSEYGIAVVVLLTCLFTLVAHWLACIWHGIGYFERANEFGWIKELSRQLNEVNHSSNSTTPSISTRYITALYFTLSSITSVGFGNVSPNTDAEKIFSVCVMIIGALMYASIFGNMTAIIHRLYSRTSRFHRDLKVIEDFVRFYKIPKSTREELDEYFRHEWAYTKGVDIETVLKRFPDSLQADVCLHLHSNLFAECAVFKSASEGCLRALALRFKIRHYLPGHFIIKQGDEVKRLYFIAKGNIEVLKYDETMLTLGKGDIISCDYSAVQNIPQANASLRVQTHGEIHSVAWSELVVVLRAYPTFRQEFITHLELAYNLGIVKEEEESDFPPNDLIPASPGRLSYPRSTFSSRIAVDRLERSGSATFFVNGKIPQVPSSSKVDLLSRQNADSDGETTLQAFVPTVNSTNLTVASVAQESCSHSKEFAFIEKRLDNLETRLIALEKKLTGNFETILSYLRSAKGRSAPELRNTII